MFLLKEEWLSVLAIEQTRNGKSGMNDFTKQDTGILKDISCMANSLQDTGIPQQSADLPTT